jgi:hypothetical protein
MSTQHEFTKEQQERISSRSGDISDLGRKTWELMCHIGEGLPPMGDGLHSPPNHLMIAGAAHFFAFMSVLADGNSPEVILSHLDKWDDLIRNQLVNLAKTAHADESKPQ